MADDDFPPAAIYMRRPDGSVLEVPVIQDGPGVFHTDEFACDQAGVWTPLTPAQARQWKELRRG